MVSNSVRSTLVLAGALLMVSYFYLNAYKVGMVLDYLDHVADGPAVAVAEVYIGNRKLAARKIATSGFFDRDGTRQIGFVRLPDAALQAIATGQEQAVIRLAGQQATLQKVAQGDVYQALLPGHRLYVLAADDWPGMATALLTEKKLTKGLVQCLSPAVCQALVRIDGDWGAIGGPYHDYELSAARRGLPQGRWLYGPETKVSIVARRPMKIAVLMNILGAVPDQRFGFAGQRVQARSVPVKIPVIELAGKKYFPGAAIVEMDLQQGVNELVIKFSRWGMVVAGRQQPFAAYLTGLKIKEINQ